MVKRVKVTAETFDKKPSALDKLVGGRAPQEAVEVQQQRAGAEAETPTPQETTPARPAIQRTYKPTSIYLDDSQLDKLDDLAHEYKKRTGKRINRNDVVRALVDQADLPSVLAAIKLE